MAALVDSKFFFDHVRCSIFDGHFSEEQVNGINRIISEWERRELTDIRWLANMLAQTFHETGGQMVPVQEQDNKEHTYLKSKPYYPWFGRGLIQVTWKENYHKFGAISPSDMLKWDFALKALFDGMIDGMFTGYKLSDFFGRVVDDPLHARRIVNGMDEAEKILGYHRHFLIAITCGKQSEPGAISSLINYFRT